MLGIDDGKLTNVVTNIPGSIHSLGNKLFSVNVYMYE